MDLARALRLLQLSPQKPRHTSSDSTALSSPSPSAMTERTLASLNGLGTVASDIMSPLVVETLIYSPRAGVGSI